MRCPRVIFLPTVILLGCSEPAPPIQISPYCAPAVAKVAAHSEMLPILQGIADPSTRDKACSDFDSLLKDSINLYHYKKGKPENCDWGYSDEDDPSRIVVKYLNPHGGDLSKLCDWKRKDADRAVQRLESEGAAILNSLPEKERDQIQREWDANAPNR